MRKSNTNLINKIIVYVYTKFEYKLHIIINNEKDLK